jgi:hypothetical protein
VGPFEITDILGRTAGLIKESLEATGDKLEINQLVLKRCGYDLSVGQTSPKIVKHSYSILAGFIVGSFFNQVASDKQKASTKDFDSKAPARSKSTADLVSIQQKTALVGDFRFRAAVHALDTPSSHRLAARPDGAF